MKIFAMLSLERHNSLRQREPEHADHSISTASRRPRRVHSVEASFSQQLERLIRRDSQHSVAPEADVATSRAERIALTRDV
jgi:hypothetical protein